MTYHDPNARERHDRMIVAYEFDGTTPLVANLTCDGHHPQVVFDLGEVPLELELITDDPMALQGLINALTEARQRLIDHQAQHAGTPDPNQPLYVPDHWTAGNSDGHPDGHPDSGGDPA